MFALDETLHPDLHPLAWLVGCWEGAGVVGYPTHESLNFGQSIDVTHDGRRFLRWESRSFRLDEQGNPVAALATEVGYWRPGAKEAEFELLLAHPTGILEMYFGTAESAKIGLRTDGVLRSAGAKEYNAATRLYGLVNSNLMWAVDMAAVGHPLTSHVSAELKRVS